MPAAYEYSNYTGGDVTASAVGAAAVTPSDSTDFPTATRALYIGVTGNVKVTMLDSSVVTFSNVAVGVLPVRVTRVWSTSTTATGIIALW